MILNIIRAILKIPISLLDWKRQLDDKKHFHTSLQDYGKNPMYALQYKEVNIATISDVKKDFPSYCGKLFLNEIWESLVDENAKHLISLGIDQIKEDELSDAQYASLCYWIAHTENWSVIDQSSNEVKKILPPTFRKDYIAWRFM